MNTIKCNSRRMMRKETVKRHPIDQVIESTFPQTLKSSRVSQQTRDLAEHLMAVVISSASASGPTSREICGWIRSEAVKLPGKAFWSCVNSLRSTLGKHPSAQSFMPAMTEAIAEAALARKHVFAFHQARTLLAGLHLQNSASLFKLVGVPDRLFHALKKHHDEDSWYPHPALLGRDDSGIAWGLPPNQRWKPKPQTSGANPTS